MIQVGPRALSLLLVAVLLSLLAPRAALGNASLSAGALDDQVSPQESQEECSPEVESWTASRLEETDRCECGTLASGSLLAAKGGGTVTKTPKTLGRDGASSSLILEKDAAGRTVSRTHSVTKDMKTVHQHQEHIGKHGGERRFPDEWTGTPTVNAPLHTLKPPSFPPGSNS